ncbi:MAG: DUF1080 domain-containing protein [Verrucomicrobiota bacterium]
MAATLAASVSCSTPYSSRTSGDGFVALFNGKDLKGWVPSNVAPETFTVKDGMIISTGIPTGVMRTERMYENFIIELEWRHMKPGGNAGLFLWGDPITSPGVPFARGIEVQILENSYGEGNANKNVSFTTHGDIFPIHGAKMRATGRTSKNGGRSFPMEERAKDSPEWNHYRVVATNGVVRLSVNGKEVAVGEECSPRKGYICLESEGSECHFRNIRLKELPPSGATPGQTAKADVGFKSLYTGIDLRNWKVQPGMAGHWVPRDWRLTYDGKAEGTEKNLWSEKEYGDFQMIVDWRFPQKPVPRPLQLILPNGDDAVDESGKKKMVEVPFAGDSGIYVRGTSKAQINITCKTIGSGEVYGYRVDKNMPPEVRAGVTPKLKADKPPGQWNRFIITMKGDRLTVELNGQTVIDNARLPGIPARGPIALQHHGDPMEFASIYIRELK